MQEIKDPDGFYESEEKKPAGKTILHKDIAILKDKLDELYSQLDTFEIPQTVSIGVEYEIEEGKIVKAGTSRVLREKETVEEAHEQLYTQCLHSILKLI